VQSDNLSSDSLADRISSGLAFVNLRAGIYTDAFPLFLNWYPSTQTVYMPRLTPPVSEANIAWTSRAELGEGIAILLVKGLSSFPSITPRTDKNLILLTGTKAEPPNAILDAINRARKTNVSMKILDPDEWIAVSAKDDEGGKGVPWFQSRLIWVQGACNGDAATVDLALATLLGRRPETGPETVAKLLEQDMEYRWHQNHQAKRQ
jgi:hypothetical protein